MSDANNNLDDVSMLWVMQDGFALGEVLLLEIVFAWSRELNKQADAPEERSKFLSALLRCLMVEQAIRAEERMALGSIFTALKDAAEGQREPRREGPPRNRRDC